MFEATPERIRVDSRIVGYHSEHPNSLLFDEAKKMLYGIGRTEDDLRRESPEVWEKRPASMHFKPIYDAVNFEPVMTWVALYFFQRAIHHQARSLLASILWGRFDQFRYELWLPNYNTISSSLRQQFEREVFLGGRREVCELTINGIANQRP